MEELLVLDNDTTSQENVQKKRMNNDEEEKEGCVLSKLLSRLSYLVHIFVKRKIIFVLFEKLYVAEQSMFLICIEFFYMINNIQTFY